LETTTTPVLFDTDIGNDIDDAVALAYLLRQPRCELLGITTVTGDTSKRAALADAVCRAAGRTDVPIRAGLTGPLLTGRGQPEVPHFDTIAGTSPSLDYGAPGDAVAFLRETIRARPGEVTLLAVGPMTNVAALFAADPEVPGLLNRLVLMCGVFTGRAGHGPGACEWNALCDPFASALVFKHAPAGRFLSVGLEVTEKCRLPADECRARFRAAGGPLSAVLSMAEVWFARQADKITFHDPLAAAAIFEPGLITTGPGKAHVVTEAGPFAGLTKWTPAEDGPHRVAYTVEPERFFAHYFSVVGG
jgi:purine nucleosidase